MILGYNIRESVAMAAILNKKLFLRWDFRGLFTRVINGQPFNFPENFSVLHFFSGWTLMLLGYFVNNLFRHAIAQNKTCYDICLTKHYLYA